MIFTRWQIVSVNHGGHKALYRFYRDLPDSPYCEVQDLEKTGIFTRCYDSDLALPTLDQLDAEAMRIEDQIGKLQKILADLIEAKVG